jgi:hypothetical protein
MKKDEIEGFIINHKPISNIGLKRLLLVFDRIHLLNPIENKALIPDFVASIKYGKHEVALAKYGVLYNGNNHEKEESRLINDFDYAFDKGILKVLDLRVRKFYEKSWLPLRLAYEYDTANAPLINAAIPLIKRENKFDMEDGVLRGMFIQPSGVDIYPKIPEAVSMHTKEENDRYKCDLQLWSALGRLNRGLAVCHEFDLIPILTDNHMANVYSLKTEVAKNCSDPKVTDHFKIQHDYPLEKVQYLMYRISQAIIPDEVMQNISVRELLHARNNTFHECIKLRRKLVKSIKFLAAKSFDESTTSEIDEYIRKEVTPLANDYNKKFLENLSKILTEGMSFGLPIGAAYYGVNQSLSPMATAFLSGASATVANVSSHLVDYLAKKSSRTKSNTFSYFINIKD